MSDGLNQARAMRVAEIMQDFRNIQHYIASIRLRPSAEEYNEEGYVLLRRCVTEAQALLAQPFQGNGNGKGGEEEKRGQLRRYVMSIWEKYISELEASVFICTDRVLSGSSSTQQSDASKRRRSTSERRPRCGG